MADYNEVHGYNLLTNSSDVDGDAFAVRKIGETVGGLAVPASYPATYNLTIGTITVENSAGDCYITLVSDTNNPADGNTTAAGTIYFTVIDEHGVESATHATVTVNLYGSTGGSAAYVETGLVERWAADAGVTLSGSDVTDWLGQVAGLNLDADGTPQLGTPPGGTASATMVIGVEESFTGTTLTGLPQGAAERTVQMVSKLTGFSFWAGFGWGSSGNNEVFTIAYDDAGELGLDYKGNRVSTGMIPTNQWTTTTATYDGTTIKVYLGDVLVASAAVALTTGAALINVCRSFSGYTTQAEIGEVLVYGRELSDAERAANVAYLNGRFIGSTAVSDPAAATGSALAETSFTANITTNSPYCIVAWSARASSTPATESEILAGTGAIDYGVTICNGSGAIAVPVTGGAASTAYYVNAIVYGVTGGKSNVVTSSAITTTAAPGANPVLSAAGLTATGQTTATGTVTTDVGNGTLKYGLMLSTATTPNITQLEAGTDGDGAPLIGGLRTQAVTATGAQGVSFTALTAGTGYKVAYGQRDGSGNASNIVTDTATTQSAGSGTSLDPDSTAATATALYAILDGWEADWNGTTPSGKTNADVRVAQLTAPYAGSMTITNDFSAYPGVIVRGVGPYTDKSTYPYYPECGSHVSGTITISGSDNLIVYGITAQKLVSTGSTNCGFDRCSAHSRWSTSRSYPSVSGPGAQFSNSPANTLTDCHIGGFNTLSIDVAAGCDDFAAEGFYVEQWSDDIIKARIGSATVSRMSVTNNWAGRDNLSPSGAHSDFNQNQSGNTPDYLFRGNVAIEGASLNGVSFQGGLWQSNTNVANNCEASQNILAIRGQNALNLNGGTNTTNNFNTLMYSEYGANGSLQPAGELVPKITGGWTVNAYNFACRTTTGAADTSGTGGIVFTIGNLWNSSVVADTSGYVPYFDGFPGEQTYIDAIKPKVGSAAHWNYSGQKVGAWERSKEIFEDGIHPGNIGWPVAGPFHREYDPSNTLGSSWTGTYDADGNNDTGSSGTLTVNDFTLDGQVFDVGAPVGGSSANVYGSGTADPFAVVEAKPSGLGTWQTIATANGSGVWSGTIPVTEDGVLHYLDVRLAASTGVTAQTTNRFTTGHVGTQIGQSNNARLHETFYDQITHPTVSDTTNLIIRRIDHGQATPTTALIRVDNSSSSSSSTKATAAEKYMSNILAELAPGKKFMFYQGSLPTYGPQAMVNDADTNRYWAGMQEIYDYSRNTLKTEVSWIGVHWYAAVASSWKNNWLPNWAPIFFQQLSGGAAVTLGTTAATPNPYTLDHSLMSFNGSGSSDLSTGAFYRNKTKLSWMPPKNRAPDSAVSSPLQGAPWYTGQFFDTIRNTGIPGFMADSRAIEVFDTVGAGAYNLLGDGGSHAAPNDVDGHALFARYIALNWLIAAGIVTEAVPSFTSFDWATDGTYLDAIVDLTAGGTLTTLRTKRSLSLSAQTSYPSGTTVVGGWLNGTEALKGVIQASTGSTARVRFTRNSGTFANGNAFKFGPGSSPCLSQTDNSTYKLHLDVPIVDHGWTTLDGIPLTWGQTSTASGIA